MSNAPYTIKDGRMVDSKGNEFKPEIGNPEHIEINRELEKIGEAFLGDGLVCCPSVSVKVDIAFRCVCGKWITVEGDGCELDDAMWDLVQMGTNKCESCGQEFEYVKKGDDIVVKLTNED